MDLPELTQLALCFSLFVFVFPFDAVNTKPGSNFALLTLYKCNTADIIVLAKLNC